MSVTLAEIETLCRNINVASRTPLSQFKEVKAPDGTVRLEANVGVFYIEQAYGMVGLSRQVEGGSSCIFGFSSKPELQARMRSYLMGIYFATSEEVIGRRDQEA